MFVIMRVSCKRWSWAGKDHKNMEDSEKGECMIFSYLLLRKLMGLTRIGILFNHVFVVVCMFCLCVCFSSIVILILYFYKCSCFKKLGLHCLYFSDKTSTTQAVACLVGT